VQILLLGTFHFAGSEVDAVSNDPLDLSVPGRTEEISAIVDALAAFAPTRIAVEVPVRLQDSLDEQYRRFLDGAAIGLNEVEQIAMRLASRVGLAHLDAVDHMDVDSDAGERLEALVAVDERAAHHFSTMLAWARESIDRTEADLASGTIGSVLRTHNDPEVQAEEQRMYLAHMLAMSSRDHQPGPDWLAHFYRRNFGIVANILELAESGDRVVALFGGAHIPFMREALAASADVEIVDPLPFLADL
jgi:Family of unknown function (DUF5694)